MNATVTSENSDATERESEAPCWKFWARRRHLVACLVFFCTFTAFTMRVNLSVAIVAMTTNYTVKLEDGTFIEKRDFDWNSATVGWVLSSFFYGYVFTQLPGGWFATKFGAHKLLLYSGGFVSVLALLTPPLASVSVYCLIAIRILQGIFQGVVIPSTHAIWARWAPPLERSRLTTVMLCGCYMGTVVALPVSGVLAEKAGWPYIFYFFGAMGLVWCLMWWLVVKESPELDPKMSPKELKYIQDSLGGVRHSSKMIIPWKKILTSRPVWAANVAQMCSNWGFYTLITQTPIFMRDVLHFTTEEAGFMSSIPFLVLAVMVILAGHMADWFQKKGILTTTQVRKVFTGGGFLVQASFMLLAVFLLTPPAVSVACLTLAVGLGAVAWAGYLVNFLDLSPPHAGLMLGIGNTFATAPGFVSPTVSGYIVKHQSVEEWRIVFYIACAIYVFGTVFYGLFASGLTQPWSAQPGGQSQQATAVEERAAQANSDQKQAAASARV